MPNETRLFKPFCKFKPIAGFEVHEKEIALSAKYVVYMIPVIEIIKGITGITAGKRDVPGFRGIVGREEIRSPMRQADTLLSCEIKTIWSQCNRIC